MKIATEKIFTEILSEELEKRIDRRNTRNLGENVAEAHETAIKRCIYEHGGVKIRGLFKIYTTLVKERTYIHPKTKEKKTVAAHTTVKCRLSKNI